MNKNINDIIIDAARSFLENVEKSNVIVYILDKDLNIIYKNDYAKTLSEQYENENLERIKQFLGDPEIKLPSNIHFFRFLSNNEVYYFYAHKTVYEEILKEYLQLQLRLSESNNLLAFLEQSSEGFCLINEERKISLWSQMLEDLTGIKKSKILNQKADLIFPILFKKRGEEKDKIKETLDKIYNEKRIPDEIKEVTIPFTMKSGEKRYLQQNIFTILTEKGLQIGCIIRDVTEKKLSAEKIQKSLDEKVILLREIHHRVKNNLQIISSLLTLQSDYIKDKNALTAILESQNRIKSMALIHELLYKSNNFYEINAKEYLTNLADSLFRSYKSEDKRVQLILDLDNFQINIDRAINCGLILNELISNSLKYAFNQKANGVITISFKESQDNYYIMKFSDNGVGLPKNFKFETAESLGLKLVNALKEQLSAELEINNSDGLSYTFKFNIDE